MDATATGPEISVAARGLSRRFGEVVAAEDVAFEVRRGDFFGFLGPNGAGKSTTLKMLTGLLRPDAGTAEILGQDVWTDPVAAKATIGILPEEAPLHDRLTGWELLQFAGQIHGLPRDLREQRAAELCDLMELSMADRHRLAVDYSTGMAKKIALATAMIHAPRVLFLDEPFNGIDPVAGRAIRQALQTAASRGVTVVFSSHILEVAERLCTRYAIIAAGRIQATGTLDELRATTGAGATATLEEVFVRCVGAEPPRTTLDWL